APRCVGIDRRRGGGVAEVVVRAHHERSLRQIDGGSQPSARREPCELFLEVPQGAHSPPSERLLLPRRLGLAATSVSASAVSTRPSIARSDVLAFSAMASARCRSVR